MNVQFWQIASGLGVGAFIASLFYYVIKQFGKGKGKGIETTRLTATATAVISVLIIVIFGAITVVALVLYAPTPANDTQGQHKRLLLDRYANFRKILEDEADHTPDKEAFGKVRKDLEGKILVLEDALSKDDMTRVHETTKSLLLQINKDETKKVMRPEAIPAMSASCRVNFQLPSMAPTTEG